MELVLKKIENDYNYGQNDSTEEFFYHSATEFLQSRKKNSIKFTLVFTSVFIGSLAVLGYLEKKMASDVNLDQIQKALNAKLKLDSKFSATNRPLKLTPAKEDYVAKKPLPNPNQLRLQASNSQSSIQFALNLVEKPYRKKQQPKLATRLPSKVVTDLRNKKSATKTRRKTASKTVSKTVIKSVAKNASRPDPKKTDFLATTKQKLPERLSSARLTIPYVKYSKTQIGKCLSFCRINFQTKSGRKFVGVIDQLEQKEILQVARGAVNLVGIVKNDNGSKIFHIEKVKFNSPFSVGL